ncbi:unnamed protein product [Cuscuta epithymum]|uniref:C2 domain-containing protein n=2 Tax=Cuscuta epithymum TaxID=186058 RepID=A0AAV0FNW2_9ASTE|nr:unnamed protein product [Cuscuta epithymum]
MVTLQTHSQYLSFTISSSPRLLHFRNPSTLSFHGKLLFPRKTVGVRRNSSLQVKGAYTKDDSLPTVDEDRGIERPPFDINLAVILAGFAFEAYTSPPENAGKHEVDAANCQTVFLSESFVREIYDGQLLIKLKRGIDLPAMDPWGTSDPYVIMQLDSAVAKSKVKWGTKEPTWNEEFALNIKQPPVKDLQLAAWDGNLVTPHKRMGNASVNLESLCDGEMHEVVVGLQGMGGGGKLQIEIKYKSFDKVQEEKKWWHIPIITELLERNGFESALKTILGSEVVQAREFVQFAFPQLKLFNNADIQKEQTSNETDEIVKPSEHSMEHVAVSTLDISLSYSNRPDRLQDPECSPSGSKREELNPSGTHVVEASLSDKSFWKNFAEMVNHNVVQRLGFPAFEKIRWDELDFLNKIGLQFQEVAEAGYIESGLATPEKQETLNSDGSTERSVSKIINTIQSSLPDIKKATGDLLRQADSILGAHMVLNSTASKLNKEVRLIGSGDTNKDSANEIKSDVYGYSMHNCGTLLNEKNAEEMRELFTKAETAMEAWAMLATSLGHPTFIKSEFDKICFLDNSSTDTQVALWRDQSRKRLVVAFRGTEQARWKDLRTDLMVVPTGLNPERIGGDFKQEVQVHSGFLSAYDSVRTKLILLIKKAIGYVDNGIKPIPEWHVYVTGHSLGGALATLLALELSSSQLAKRGAVSVTMYNFGSPRVGNKPFAEVYNEKVKDSWRVVNHRDIIPTVPRLMGYCHVAQPVYLAAGDLKHAMPNIEQLEDGYQGDIIGETTPDVIVSEFMKGEKELIEKILNTEINIFRAIRDGSALMQHMEDFYYITLLENVRSNYQTVTSQPAEDRSTSIG